MAKRIRRGTPEAARRNLRLAIITFFLALALPLGFLVLHVYDRLEVNAAYHYRALADDLVLRINKQIFDVLEPEEKRAFDDYSFLKVAESKLFTKKGLSYSPLSEIPPRSSFPGIVGYFQITPAGQLQSPVLPEADDMNAVGKTDPAGADYNRRVALRDELHGYLSGSRLLASSRRSAPQLAAKWEPQKLSEFNLDTMELGKQGERREPEYDTQVAQSFVREKRKRYETSSLANSALQKQVLDEFREDGFARQEDADARVSKQDEQKDKDLKPEFVVFRGEIDPLQWTVLANGDFAFHRNVWSDGKRYIQGFVAKREAFLQAILGDIFQTSVLGTNALLMVVHNGNLIQQFAPQQRVYSSRSLSSIPLKSNSAAQEAISVFSKSHLLSPLDKLEILFATDRIPLGPESRIVDALVVVLALVLIPGLYGIYRLGLYQIVLAEKRSDFVSAISHELKTPLTSIRMYGEMLRSGWISDEAKKHSYYDFIFFESERLSRLIGNILQLAKLSKDETPLALKEFLPSEVLEIARTKVQAQVQACGFTLEMAQTALPGHGKITVLAEEDAIARIFINLVDNALKFSKEAESKKVTIGYRLLDSGVRPKVAFYVRDYGPGVPRSEKKKIFELFYRVESELTRTTTGTGIGLALVRELASKMSAEVDLHSADPGVEFQLVFEAVDGINESRSTRIS